MDTSRRRSHQTEHEYRADKLTALLVRILEQYRDDIEVHDCESCMVNVEIFEREARALGAKLASDEENRDG